MNAQVENTEHGYIVSVWCDLKHDGNFRWHKLRNFGDRQGDAFVFRDIDVPQLRDTDLCILIKNFDITRKYIRINERKFILQRE